jgi:uncharacterized membrane protein
MAAQIYIEWLVIGLIWAHIVAILGWVGSSLYFMWLDSKLRLPKPTRENVLGEAWMGHGGGFYIVEKRHIAPGKVPYPLHWFRVEAAVTWFTGFFLLVFVYYWGGGVNLVDPATSVIGPKAAIALAVVSLPVSWLVYDRIWTSELSQTKARLANVISFALLLAVIVIFCRLFNGRAAFIHVGAVIGTCMVANVWARIIPAQEEAVAATRAGRERNARRAAWAKRRATHNTYLTLPVIMTMIANHTPSIYGHHLNWVLLALLVVIGVAARHLMILFDRREPKSWRWVSAFAPLAASIVVIGILSISPGASVSAERTIDFPIVRGIVDLRCGSCHSQTPTDRAFVTAPDGVAFDTADQIQASAAMIKAVVGSRTMPPGNSTAMTDEERTLIARWDGQGEPGH